MDWGGDPGRGLGLKVISEGATMRSLPVMRGTGSTQIQPSPHSAGVFRAYATQLNNAAADGAGRNSPFTKALLKHIGTAGISIQELMIRVRKDVMLETRNAQIPWEEAALNETFSFVGLPPSAVASPASTGPRSAATAGPSPGSERPVGSGRPSSSAPVGGTAPRSNLPPGVGLGAGMGL